MTEPTANRSRSEPRRFRLSWLTTRGYTVSVPNLLTDGEYMAVREDRATEADLEAVEAMLNDDPLRRHTGMSDDQVALDSRLMAKQILDKLFGEDPA